MKRLRLLLAGAAALVVFSSFAAGRAALEPKVHETKDGVFASATRIEGVDTEGNSVVVEGDRLYYGASHELYVYDISTPLSPKLLGKVDGLGRVRQMAVWKGMVYIASREAGLWIVDARDAASPKILSRFDTIELATGVSVCGNLVMLGQRQNGVEFIDVTDPLKPAHIRIEKTRESQSTLYRDGICYSGDWGAGEVTMIDARDMRTVKTLRTVKLRGHGDGLDVQGNLLYASTGHHYHDLSAKRWRSPKPGEKGFGEGHALEIIDISDPAAPKVLGRCKFDTFYTIGMDMWMPRASGDYVFCADTFNGLYAVEAKDPAAMRVVGRITVPDPRHPDNPGTPVTSVAVGHGAVYMAARECGLVVVDCPVARARKPVYPPQPAHVDSRADYRAPSAHFDAWLPKRTGQVRAVAPFGDFVYVACGQAGLSVLKRKGRGYAEVASFDLPFCGDVKVRDGRLYSAEALQGLAVYDLADPARPKELERVTNFGTPVCCPLWLWTPKTSPLVIASDRQSGYMVMDPAHGWKRLLLSPGCPGWDRYFSDEPVGGRYFAQSLANVGFAWIDLGATPPKVIRSRVNTSGLNDGCLAWRGDRLLLVSKGEFLYLKPGQSENADGSHWKGVPFGRAEGPRGGQPAWDGLNGLALTERIDKSVWRLDMTDENAPKVLWGEKTVGLPDHAEFHDGRLLVPCGYQGLLIEKSFVPVSGATPAKPSRTAKASAAPWASAGQIVLVGDSTLAPRKPEQPAGSWGEALAPYLKSGVTIRDFAIGGRTVRTTLPTWQKTLAAIRPGDIVIIQFGINDANKRKFVAPDEFKETLAKFVRESQEKGGRPIVCSPLANAGYRKDAQADESFRLQPSRQEYGEYSREVAEKTGVPFVDMTALTAAEFTRRGRAETLSCFVGDSTRDGKPVFDTTHPSKAGARVIAGLFVREATARNLSVAAAFRAKSGE